MLNVTLPSVHLTGQISQTDWILLDNEEYLQVEVVNGPSLDLTDFLVYCRNDGEKQGDGTAFILIHSTDYATATHTMPFCETTVPNTLVAGNTSHFTIFVKGHSAVRFVATTASGTPAFTVRANGA
jgi:hypothetical protein